MYLFRGLEMFPLFSLALQEVISKKAEQNMIKKMIKYKIVSNIQI